jgi:hypothetical protein
MGFGQSGPGSRLIKKAVAHNPGDEDQAAGEEMKATPTFTSPSCWHGLAVFRRLSCEEVERRPR